MLPFLTALPPTIKSIPIERSPYPAPPPLPQSPPQSNISWVLYAPAQGYSPANLYLTKRLLERGIALAMLNVGESAGSPTSTKLLTQLHQTLTTSHNLAPKPVLWPQSRGG